MLHRVEKWYTDRDSCLLTLVKLKLYRLLGNTNLTEFHFLLWEQQNQVKYLGVILDSKLNLNNHVMQNVINQ